MSKSVGENSSATNESIGVATMAMGAVNTGLPTSQVSTERISAREAYDAIKWQIGMEGVRTLNQRLEREVERERLKEMVPENSVAASILSRKDDLTDKQKWAVAYELAKSQTFIKERQAAKELEARSKESRAQKMESSKQRQAAMRTKASDLPLNKAVGSHSATETLTRGTIRIEKGSGIANGRKYDYQITTVSGQPRRIEIHEGSMWTSVKSNEPRWENSTRRAKELGLL